MELPLDEAFVFMEMDLKVDQVKQEREAEKFWLDFLAKIYSNPPQEGESPEFVRKRMEFMEAAKPKQKETEKEKVPKSLEEGWANIPQEEIDKALRLREEEGVEKGG